jgi:5-methylcytosine-specific restriction endonuclease McrA
MTSSESNIDGYNTANINMFFYKEYDNDNNKEELDNYFYNNSNISNDINLIENLDVNIPDEKIILSTQMFALSTNKKGQPTNIKVNGKYNSLNTKIKSKDNNIKDTTINKDNNDNITSNSKGKKTSKKEKKRRRKMKNKQKKAIKKQKQKELQDIFFDNYNDDNFSNIDYSYSNNNIDNNSNNNTDNNSNNNTDNVLNLLTEASNNLFYLEQGYTDDKMPNRNDINKHINKLDYSKLKKISSLPTSRNISIPNSRNISRTSSRNNSRNTSRNNSKTITKIKKKGKCIHNFDKSNKSGTKSKGNNKPKFNDITEAIKINTNNPDISLSDVVLKIQSLKGTLPQNTDYNKRKIRQEVWTEHNGSAFESVCYIDWCTNIVNVFNYQVGHDIPKSKGGPNTLENLKPICESCNQSMGNKYTIKEWNKLFQIPEQKKELLEHYKYVPHTQLLNNKSVLTQNNNELQSKIIKSLNPENIEEIKATLEKKVILAEENTRQLKRMNNYCKLFVVGSIASACLSLYVFNAVQMFK